MSLTKQQLSELKELLEDQLDKMGIVGASSRDSIANHGDLADLSTSQWSSEINIELGEHDYQKAKDIMEALQRMEAGEYGICEMSGEEIPFARLKAKPTARYTAQCREIIEQQGIAS